MALQENYIVNDDSSFQSDFTFRGGQLFTALEGYTLSSIKFKGYRNLTGKTVTAEIYAADAAGLPTGSILSSGTISTSTMTGSSPGAWYTVTMSSYSIVGGVEYALVIWCGGSDYVEWRKDTTVFDYYGGTGVYSANSGTSWSMPTEEDYMFEIHSSAIAGDAIEIGELYSDERDSNTNLNYTSFYRSQSFTTQASYDFSKVTLRLKMASGGSTGTVIGELYAADGSGKPTGSVLDSGTWDISTGVTTANGALEDITGFSGYTLAASTEYCIVMRTDATGDAQVFIHRNVGRYSYPNGIYAFSSDLGASWTTSAVTEVFFQIWFTVVGETHELEGPVPGVGGIAAADPPEVTFQVGYGAGNEATVPGTGGIASSGVDLSSIYNLGILMVPLPRAVAPHPGKDVDDDYDSQFASIKAYEIAAKIGSATTEDGASTFVRVEETGIVREGFQEENWLNRVHLLPRTVQILGNIVSVQTFDVELYNADRTETITISSITNNFSTGVSIAGVPAVPFTLAPRENVEAVVTIDTIGALNIDDDYTFTQSTGETYTIYLTGSRIVMFPIRPEAPMREHLVFDTKILTAVDGSEQRIANRKIPRSIFEMTIKDERKMMELLLMDRQSKICATPAWHEPAFVSTAVTALDTTVNVNTTDYANFYVGGYAIVFQDQYVYDALEIASMTSTSLTFTSGVTNAYTENTEVMPLMVAYFNHQVATAKNLNKEQTFNLRLTVDAVDNSIASAAAFPTYDSKVFLSGPNLVTGNQLSEVMERKVLVLDNITGLLEEFSQWDRSKRRSNKGFKTNDRQELWELRQLLHFLKGQQVSFYIPTFSEDLIPNTKLNNASSTFTMDNIGYTVNARDRAPKDYFRLLLTNGTEITRTVTNSAEVSIAVEQLTVDSPWPYDIEVADIARIDFLEKVRLNIDDIVITHYNALGQSKTFMPTKEVFD